MKDARETIRRFRKSERNSAEYFWKRFSASDAMHVVPLDGRDPFRRLVEKERPSYDKLVERARQRVLYYAPQAVSVLRLIIRNGSNRKESIWQLMKMMSRCGMQRKTNTIATGRS